jgi:hypothetical protein
MGNERLFEYNGPTFEGQCAAKPEAPVSPSNGLNIVRAAFLAGRKHVSQHFKARSMERKFDTLDAQNVITTGNLCCLPEYCPDFETWKFRIIADLEDEKLDMRKLEIVVALDPAEDYEKSPLIILVTGYWR